MRFLSTFCLLLLSSAGAFSQAPVKQDSLFFQAQYFFSYGPNFPTQENDFVYVTNAAQKPMWRALVFEKNFSKEITGFALVGARLDTTSVHKYEVTLYYLPDTSTGANFQKRTLDDSKKSVIGSIFFEIGKKGAGKLETTGTTLRVPIDLFGNVPLVDGRRVKLNGAIGMKVSRAAPQDLSESKTNGAFYGLYVIFKDKK